MSLAEARKIAGDQGLSPETVEAIETFGPEKRENYRAGEDKDHYLSVYSEPSLPRTKTEATIYRLIRNNTVLRAPRTVGYNEKYILVEGLDGENYSNVFEESGKQEKSGIVKEHAKGLAQIHSIPVDREVGEFSGEGFQKYDDWRGFIQDRIDNYRSRASLGIEKKAVEWLEENIDLIDRNIETSVVHNDFHAWNTLKKENQPIGVLDAEQGFFGDKEYDVAKTMSRWTDKHDLSEEFLEEYRRQSHLEDGYEDRLPFYKIEIYLRGTINAREKVEGGRESLRKFYKSDKRTLEELLTRQSLEL